MFNKNLIKYFYEFLLRNLRLTLSNSSYGKVAAALARKHGLHNFRDEILHLKEELG